MGYTPLATAPAAVTAPGVVIEVHGMQVPQLPPHHPSTQTQEGRAAAAVTASPPFHYKIRCITYSLLLLCSLIGFAMACCTFYKVRWTTIDVRLNATAVGPDYWPAHQIQVMMTELSYFSGYIPTHSLEDALQPIRRSSLAEIFLMPPSRLRLARGVAQVARASTVLLLLCSAAMLGVLYYHQYSHTARAAAQREGEGEADETAHLDEVCIHAPTVAARQQRHQLLYEASVRQGLAVACFLFCFTTLVMSVVAVAANSLMVTNMGRELDRVMAKHRGVILSVRYDIDLGRHLFFWPHIVNLMVFAVATVLLHVPRFSGIHDRE